MNFKKKCSDNTTVLRKMPEQTTEFDITFRNGKNPKGDPCLKYGDFCFFPYRGWFIKNYGMNTINHYHSITTENGNVPADFVKVAELIEHGLKANFNEANKTSTNELLKRLELLKKDAERQHSFKLLEKAEKFRGY